MARVLDIPQGSSANVSVLDTASIGNLPLEPYFECDVPRLHRTRVPVFSYIITSSCGRRVLFDLGLRKDWRNLSPVAVSEVFHDELDIDCEHDVRDILEGQNIVANDIEAIILR